MKTPAKKRFGQHFLRDTGVLGRITRLIDPMPGDVVIEIGAGDGALSVRLAPAVARLLAIELDVDCLQPLTASLAPFPSAVVIQGDILELDLGDIARAQLKPGQRLRAVGNLPYNIATAIIQKLLRSPLPIADMLFMVQLEVAERITAAPGSRKFGLLSVHSQHLSEVGMAFKVSSACFVPRPRVTSAIVTFRPRRRPLDPVFEACFIELVGAAFNHRRKTLANSLRRHPSLSAGSATLLSEAGIDGSRRPEDLSVNEYEQLVYTLLRLRRGQDIGPQG